MSDNARRSAPPMVFASIHHLDFPFIATPVVVSEQGEMRALIVNGPIRAVVASLPTSAVRVGTEGQRSLSPSVRQLDLPAGTYFVTEWRPYIQRPEPGALRDFYLWSAEIAATIETEVVGVLGEQFWEGPISGDGRMLAMSPYPVRVTSVEPVDPVAVVSSVQARLGELETLSLDDRRRLRFSGRWICRSATERNPIDKLLSLWTSLEIFPAKNTTNVVRATSEYIARSLGDIDRKDVSRRLWLGWTHALRSTIVHDGHDFIEPGHQSVFDQYLDRLATVVAFCFRSLGGIQMLRC